MSRGTLLAAILAAFVVLECEIDLLIAKFGPGRGLSALAHIAGLSQVVQERKILSTRQADGCWLKGMSARRSGDDLRLLLHRQLGMQRAACLEAAAQRARERFVSPPSPNPTTASVLKKGGSRYYQWW